MKYDFSLDMDTDNSLSLILRNVKKDSIVLEFGPANGRMTKYMKEQLGCRVYLAELDEAAGKEALKYGEELIVGDIEDYQWKDRYKDIRFDHIIFADVLEHLRHPLKVLTEAKAFLKQEGTILLSVPNLAHNSVLIDLMNNKFQYRPTGLLDDTHIHFFTRTGLDEMIKSAELYPVKQMATYAQVGAIEIENSTDDVKEINRGFWNRRKYGEIYQYVYIVSQNRGQCEELIKSGIPHYYCQVYYEKNQNWNENQSLRLPISNEREAERFFIKLPEKMDSIRLDPMDCNGIVNIISIYTDIAGEQKQLECIDGNYDFKYQNYYWFSTNDPMIIYRLPEKNDSITIECTYELIDFDDDKGIGNIVALAQKEIETSNMKVQATENENEGLKSENAMLAGRCEYEKSRADILQAQRDRLENRKLYKIYKFLKGNR